MFKGCSQETGLKQTNVNQLEEEEEVMFLDKNIHEAATQTRMIGSLANVNEPTGNIYTPSLPPLKKSASYPPN